MGTRSISMLTAATLLATACSTTSSEASSGSSTPTTQPAIGLEPTADVAAGSTAADAEPLSRVDSIVIIGDSLTVAATPALDEQFARLGFDDVTIVAQEGKRLDADPGSNASGAAISRFVAADTDIPAAERLWIVALGTNDVGNAENIDTIVTEIDRVLAPIPLDAPLIWINTYVDYLPEETSAVNTAIDAAVVDRGNAVVGRWDAAALADGVISGDGVHTTDVGSTAFATLVTSTVTDFVA